MIGQTLVAGAAMPRLSGKIFLKFPQHPTARCPIDKLVFAELARLNIEPVLCSEAVFVHRVYLDVIGTLPTAQEAREFIENSDPNEQAPAC